MVRELDVLASIDHPHIIQVKELLHDNDKYYIATEICEGGELFDRLAQKDKFTEKETG